LMGSGVLMKPTKVMQDLLRYMADDYSLMYTRHHTWLSDPYGVKSQNVRLNTFLALRKRHLISTKDRTNSVTPARFHLTPEGKAAVNDQPFQN
jgi:hypothetical protein